MSGVRVCSSPDLLPLSTNNHEDLSIEGIATNVKLLLKLVQDHQDASHKGAIDERKAQRFAGMMTILDDVKTRLQKTQTSGKKSRAELRRCNTDLKIHNPPRDGTKKDAGIILDEKERLRRDLNTSFAAQKRLGAMCASLGREKEIISRELTRKVQELNEMEQHLSDLRQQNERLSSKIRASVAENKDMNGIEFHHLSSTALQDRNKELSDQLLKSLEGYKLIKRKLKGTQEEKEEIQTMMHELGNEIKVGIEHINDMKLHLSVGDWVQQSEKIKENINALDKLFKTVELRVSNHIMEDML